MSRSWTILLPMLLQTAYGLPLAFEPNRGQAPAGAAFVGHTRDGIVLVGARGAILRFGTVDLRLRGARLATPVGEERMPGVANYLRGSDRTRWVTGVPQFGRVRYREVYPGIDLVLHGAAEALEYDFEVAPGADPARIRLQITGGGRLAINTEGELEIAGAGSRLVHRAPVAYQSGRKVEARMVVQGREVRFALGAYDRSKPLTIDPIVRYGTYLGGRSRDLATGVAVDAAGNSYVTGYTISPDFPVTANALQVKHAGTPNDGITFVGGVELFDAFVAKFSADGSQLIYATYLGGRDDDRASAIAVDKAGNATIAGTTRSTNFPLTSGAAMSTMPVNATAGFLTKLNAGGSDLIYSTLITGSSGDSRANAVALDAAGNAWVAGSTGSASLPVTAGAYQAKLGGTQDGFVLKLNPQASAILYGTFLGGQDADSIAALAVDAAGSCYVAGTTFSLDFPTKAGAPQAKLAGRSDAFVTQLSADGKSLVFSTFGGGSQDDSATAIALGADNSIYVTGTTFSSDFPATAGAFQEKSTSTSSSAFAMHFNAGGALHYATLLGGSGANSAAGLAVMEDGTAVVAGQTRSLDFPVSADAYQKTPSGVDCTTFVSPFPMPPANAPCSDAFLTMVHTSGRRLVYSTLLGGSGDDAAAGVALAADGSVVLGGATGSSDFVTTRGAFRTTRAGGQCTISFSPTAASSFACEDAFVVKIDPLAAGGPRPVAAVANGANGVRGPVGPGEFVSLFGLGIGPKGQDTARLGADGRVTTTLLGTTVSFDGVPAPLLYVGPNQINCIVPFAVAGKAQTVVRVETPEYADNVASLAVAATAPGIFSLSGTGQGQAAALNQDLSINGPANAAARGSVLVLYGTGAGQTATAGIDGRLAIGAAAALANVAVRIGGLDAKVLYAGNAPGLVEGVVQVNVLVPDGVVPGAQVPVVLTAGAASSQPLLFVAIR